ncbi:MAG TPA: hypothetical protein VJ746_04605 [Nitrospira sp.]|nr:hypothetical protein [Nitrospira sp.]
MKQQDLSGCVRLARSRLLTHHVGVAGIALLLMVSTPWWSLAKAKDDSKKTQCDVHTMSFQERLDLGEKLIFGEKGASRTKLRVGRAQCTLCHDFFEDQEPAAGEQYPRPSPPYGPHFFPGFTERIERLLASQEYRNRSSLNTEQPEAFPGSGIATNVIEYLAESNVCPSCYVVPGLGWKGTQDRQSPMPKIHKPPISLTVDEMIAIDTWLYIHDGEQPPSQEEIKRAYKRFIPDAEWHEIDHPCG